MKVCSKCGKENENVKGKYCIYCGGKLVAKEKMEKKKKQKKDKGANTNKKSIKFIITIGIFLIIISILVGVIIYLIASNDSDKKITALEKEISTLESQNKTLKSEKSQLEKNNKKMTDKIKFFDERVVFVIDGYGNYYYTYDQMQQVTQGKTYRYWAYNVEQATDLGYQKWK